MPLLEPIKSAKYSERGPVPRPLSMGDGLAVMLLCLQKGQEIVAPEADNTETLFTVLEGSGFIREDDAVHKVSAGNVVHVLPGSTKSLIAGEGTLLVLGTRRMKGKASAP